MFCALMVLMLVIPRTKHIESRILDFPLPFRPVIELKVSSQPLMTVRTAYDLKPSMTISTTLMLTVVTLIGTSLPVRYEVVRDARTVLCLPYSFCG